MAWSIPSTVSAAGTILASTTNALIANFQVMGGSRSTWSPTLTNLTIGNGSQIARYRQVDKEVTFYWQLTFGSTTAFTGNVTITLPANPAAGVNGWAVPAVCLDSSAGVNYGGFSYNTTSSTMAFRVPPTTAGNSWVAINATQPFSWATGDTLTISGSYEAA